MISLRSGDIDGRVELLGLHEVDPFAEERILLRSDFGKIQFGGEGAEFALCQSGTNRNLVVGGSSAGSFGFDADQDGVAELVHGSFGGLDEIADICIGPCEEGCCGRTRNKLRPDAVFDFLTGGLVERDDSESLFGVTFCVAYGGKRNGLDLVGNFLDGNTLEDFVVCCRQLLDSVLVDAVVCEAYNGGIAILRGEPELAGGCPVTERCRKDAFLEEGATRNGFFVEGVDGHVFVARVVGIAHKNGLGSGQQERYGFGKGDSVGIENDGDVEGLLVGNAECVCQGDYGKDAMVCIDCVM